MREARRPEGRSPVAHGRSKICRVARALDLGVGEAVTKALSPRRASVLLIAISLLFAAAMIAAAWFLRGSEHAQTVVFLLIAVWWVPFSVLSSASTATRRRRCGKKA